MGRFTPKEPTVAEVRAKREEMEVGLVQAKHTVRLGHIRDSLIALRAGGTLEEKVEFLLDVFERDLLRQFAAGV